MSAASSLLRRRSSQVLTSLLKHRQREYQTLSGSSFGSNHGFQIFATREHLPAPLSPHGPVQDWKPFGAITDGHRRFATNREVNGPASPSPPDVSFGPARLAKMSAVAATIAALTWVAYISLDGRSKEILEIFSKPTDEQQGRAAEVKDKTVTTAQVMEAPEKNPHVVEKAEHQSKGQGETESRAEVTEATSAMIKMCEETDAKPKVIEESNSMLQVIQVTPLKPKAMEDFELKPEGIVGSDFQIQEIEEVESNTQITEDTNRNPQVSEDTKELPQIIGESTIFEHNGEELTITKLLDVKEEDGQSHLYEIVNHVTVDEIEADRPSGQTEIDLPFSSEGQQSENIQIEDLEPEPFRKEMQETAKEEDLMELSDKVLYNHTPGDKVEKENVSHTDETQSSEAVTELREVVIETIEAVSDLDQANKKAGVEALHPDAPQVLQGLAESYFLSEAKMKETEESTAGESVGDEKTDKSYNLGAGTENYAGAIQEAERRQAEADAQFREMLLKLDEEYQQELREARKQQELQAEYANKLEKDLSAEKDRLRALAEQQLHAVEQKLRDELKRKEEEAKRELEKMELLTQARTSAAVTMEKARQLEDTKDMQIQIEALHKVFYAQSEGTRVSHTTHKLAMGAFALEDAMTRGAPIEKEVELLRQAAGGVGNDELIDIALESLPREILKEGTLTQSQLQYEFENLRGPLRQLALIPAGQGGLLTHVIATAVAAIKVREGSGRDGVESTISTVEKYLADGQLSEAANVLEQGVKGTSAEVLVAEWAKQARARVIAEQALALVQAHAIATAAGLA